MNAKVFVFLRFAVLKIHPKSPNCNSGWKATKLTTTIVISRGNIPRVPFLVFRLLLLFYQRKYLQMFFLISGF